MTATDPKRSFISCYRFTVITLEHLNEYDRFDGDPDGWDRVHRKKGEEVPQEWSRIDELLLAMRSVATGLASKALEKSTNNALQNEVDGDEAREFLQTLASRNVKR